MEAEAALCLVKEANQKKDLAKVLLPAPVHRELDVLLGVDLGLVVLVLCGVGPKHLKGEDSLQAQGLSQPLGLDVTEKTYIDPKVRHAGFLLTARPFSGISALS